VASGSDQTASTNQLPPQMLRTATSSDTVRNLVGRDLISAKLSKLRVEEISYESTTLWNVVNDLKERARKSHPEGKGINIILNPNLPKSAGVNENMPPGAERPRMANLADVLITSQMKNARLVDILDAIAKASEVPIQYSIQPYAVVVFGSSSLKARR
jgi:hypothetical protein